MARLVGVARDGRKRPPEPLRALLHPLLRLVELRAAVGHRDAPPDRVEVAVELRSGQALEPELALPLLPHPWTGAQAVRPVDRRAAPERGPGLQRDVEVGRLLWPAAPVHVLEGPQLEHVEVGLVEVPAALEHDHLQSALRERSGDHASTRSGSDDADVGLQGHLASLGDERVDRLGFIRRRGDRPRITEGRPEGVLAGLGVGYAVGEEQHQADERAHAGRGLRPEQRDGREDLLARARRDPRDALRVEAVEQREHAGALFVGQGREHLYDRLVDAHVGGAACPEPVGVLLALDPRNDRVAGRPQRRAPTLGQLSRHGASSSS